DAHRSSSFRPLVPLQYLHPVPVQHPGEAGDTVVDGLQVFDPVRLAGDVGVDGDGHDLGAVLAFGVEAVEGVDAAPGEVFRFVVLHHHHRDVVELDRVRQGHQRAVGGGDLGRLVVVDPVAD